MRAAGTWIPSASSTQAPRFRVAGLTEFALSSQSKQPLNTRFASYTNRDLSTPAESNKRSRCRSVRTGSGTTETDPLVPETRFPRRRLRRLGRGASMPFEGKRKRQHPGCSGRPDADRGDGRRAARAAPQALPASVGGILLLKGLLGPFPNVRLPETPNSAGREVVGRVGRDVKPPAHISP